MKKVTLVVHQNYLENITKNLHEAGIMEIIDIAKNEPEILEITEKASMHPDAGLCANYELRLSRIIDILQRIKAKPSRIKTFLNPELPELQIVEDSTLDELYSYAEGILEKNEKRIIDHENKLQDLDEQKEQINLNIEQLKYLEDFDIDISDIGKSDHVIIKAGKTSDITSLKNEIKKLDKATIYFKKFGKGKKIEWAVITATHICEEEKIEKISREKIAEFTLGELTGSPRDNLESLKNEKQKINKEKKQIVLELQKFAIEQLNDLLSIREQIKHKRIRREISKNFAKTSFTTIIKGWILEKNEKELEKIVEKTSKDHIIFSFEKPSTNPDNPPTYLETPRWATPFKTLLELFATPKYNEINPMILMGIFFVLFFGIMLGDAGYGLVIIILALIGYVKFSRYSTMIKNWSFMFIWLGLTTTVVGLLTNSFFGDFIPRYVYHNLDQTLYSMTIVGIHLPIEPIRDPLTILVIALIFGLIHLNIGILLAIYQSYKNKNFRSLISEHFSWILLQIGGGLLVGNLLLHIWNLDSVLFYIAIVLLIIGLILRLIHAGPLGFFDITGYVGDWLSYARLLALGLGTTGMALAFNVVGEIIPQMIPVVGIILVPIILIITHTANLGIQTLGAAVHSLRLQYVEFFNRFYEGGGKKFQPFSMRRKYTKIKEAE